ncbi:MAG: response regulator [Terricaulis sp.]
MTPKPLVVVIEDDPICADALGLILDDWGADVVVAQSAAEAAAALGVRSASVGWIITDFNLGPGPDGVTGLRPLVLAAPAARILVLSGSFRGQATKSASAAGLDVMSKPAARDAIVAWLERA